MTDKPDQLAETTEPEITEPESAEAAAPEATEAPAAEAGAQAAEATDSTDEDAKPDFDPKSPDGIRAQIVDNLKLVYDPEIPVDIYELGLIYGIDVNEDRTVRIEMTLTSPMCPTAQQLVGQAEMAAREVPFVKDAEVELVWDPPWDMDKMSEEARLLLGF